MFDLATPENAALPHAACPRCGVEVLVYTALDEQGEPIARCLDCDAPVTTPTAEAVWGLAELAAAGYRLEGAPDPEAGSGCGGGSCGGGKGGCHH